MRFPNLNIFAAWFFMPQTIFMGWAAAAGGMLLNVLGLATTEGDIPSRMVGALLLFALVFLVWFQMRGLPPQGKAGQRLHAGSSPDSDRQCAGCLLVRVPFLRAQRRKL